MTGAEADLAMNEEQRDDVVRPGGPAPEPGEGPAGGRLTPELLEWTRQQFTEEEIVAALREMKEKGGLELREFIDELEQVVHAPEHTADGGK
jgi:hypothetical protein